MAKLLTATEIINTLLAFAPTQSIAPQAITDDTNGSAVQLDGEPAIVVFDVGLASATTVFSLDVEESANGSTGWAAAGAPDLDGGGLFADVTQANDNAAYARFYVGGANYIRGVVTDDDGGTPGLVVSCTVIKCRTLAHAKPYELDQIMDDLSRRSFDRGTGDTPVQSRLEDIVV